MPGWLSFTYDTYPFHLRSVSHLTPTLPGWPWYPLTPPDTPYSAAFTCVEADLSALRQASAVPRSRCICTCQHFWAAVAFQHPSCPSPGPPRRLSGWSPRAGRSRCQRPTPSSRGHRAEHCSGGPAPAIRSVTRLAASQPARTSSSCRPAASSSQQVPPQILAPCSY
jgi:hypothetical protein